MLALAKELTNKLKIETNLNNYSVIYYATKKRKNFLIDNSSEKLIYINIMVASKNAIILEKYI